MAGVAFGVEELLRHNVGTGGKKDDVGMTEEVPDQDLSGGTQEEPGVEEQPKDEQKHRKMNQNPRRTQNLISRMVTPCSQDRR